MNSTQKQVYWGDSKLKLHENANISGKFIAFEGQEYYVIENYDRMPAFFMSMTSADNFWFFISTTGGLTCGRTHSSNALFPYYTVDKLHASANSSGSLSMFLLEDSNDSERLAFWQPFSPQDSQVYDTRRNLYKSFHGDRIIFEEINETLGLCFRIHWETSPKYGIHRRCTVTNKSGTRINLSLLDGLRNVLPSGVSEALQNVLSNLLHAYKRTELVPDSSLAIYALSAQLSDRPEPSESLHATTVWSYGLDEHKTLLSELQISSFLRAVDLEEEYDIAGEAGAYFKYAKISLERNETKEWGMIAELQQTHSSISSLLELLQQNKNAVVEDLQSDISRASRTLSSIIDRNDGHQQTADTYSISYHRTNVLFNIMRGGYFIDGYYIQTSQFYKFVKEWNKKIAEKYKTEINSLPSRIHISDLCAKLMSLANPDLNRLCYEFLPLTFGRRHGDPSRPWNAFYIETKDSTGADKIAYQGNWRDIFQNWEALCFSYPLYFPSVIVKFLNATTVDGYNPYKISQSGFNWEVPEPDNPWSNIGYWSDHQIIYLTKLLEHLANFFPHKQVELLHENIFVFANVPYRISSFEELLENPQDSITFDYELNDELQNTEADGSLLKNADGSIVHANMLEKLVILLLAKLANYVPGGGIWMNTQRPEWNDANNALAGWGLSMVTLSYLSRFIHCINAMLDGVDANTEFAVHNEVYAWFTRSQSCIYEHSPDIVNNPHKRYEFLTSLGSAASEFRSSVYANGFAGGLTNGFAKASETQTSGTRASGTTTLSASTLRAFLQACSDHFLKTIEYSTIEDSQNKLFESYQILIVHNESLEIKPLYPMLEGQVSGLSMNSLSAKKSIEILDALKASSLFREDQHSYILYPNRRLPLFLEKNSFSREILESFVRVGQYEAKNVNVHEVLNGILEEDAQGTWHFNADFKNARDLDARIASILAHAEQGPPKQIIENERENILALYENSFKHAEFTGRSGTFFAYEGLGSIYWHMVSKLLLAVQERLVHCAVHENFANFAQLKERYLDLRKGLGLNKTPQEYGAFPCDPYSHTPHKRGAKQPGMTGQVKEGVLMRFAELGLVVKAGCIRIIPELILEKEWQEDGSLSFSYCGIQIGIQKIHKADKAKSAYTRISTDSGETTIGGLEISQEISQRIFARDGSVKAVTAYVQN